MVALVDANSLALCGSEAGYCLRLAGGGNGFGRALALWDYLALASNLTSERPTNWSATASCGLVGADHLEVLVDEDVVGPVDADVVDFVLAVAELHDTVDDTTGVGG